NGGAPVDTFGVGTSLGVGAGSVEHDIEGGALGGVYKQVLYVDERGEHPKVKVAGDKSTWPGKKEVYRVGTYEEDLIALADEPKPERSERLLRPVVIDGDVVPGSLPPRSESWASAAGILRKLPDRYHALIAAQPYPVHVSPRLRQLRDRTVAAAENGRTEVAPHEAAAEADGRVEPPASQGKAP